MNSFTTERFWKCYADLPTTIKKQAKEAYKIFQRDPFNPGLHFKKVHSIRQIFSARITKDYRALGIRQDNEIVWFWIGSHSEYFNLLKKLRNA